MNRPRPTPLLHFTHIDHLPSIVEGGLVADGLVGDRLRAEVGSRAIKDQRRGAEVPLPPGGFVCDYVPFYFAPRSPMMYAIHGGQVPEYGTDLTPLVYLESSIERLAELDIRMIFTRRNAALRNAEFTDLMSSLDQHVDWTLMNERYWRNTPEDGDRRSRRMAECLVHANVPWAAIVRVVAFDAAHGQAVDAIMGTLGVPREVDVDRDWYF